MTPPLGLFEGFGVELEYMIVDRDTLDVRPICDRLLAAIADAPVCEIERGMLCWSNELVLHVVELKTNGPAASLHGLADVFQEDVRAINDLLRPHGAQLLPTAMHPWMDPDWETKIWPHEYGAVYRAFDRIFGCRGHGWSNLQSTHLNLPFANDEEFGRLHAAIRLLLPIMPGLAASSPVVDGRISGWRDARMEMYRNNARKVPSVCGAVIPEPVYTQHRYETELLAGIYRDIAPFDPDGILQHPWLNARGAIARFDRGAIEIRVLDIQESPAADLAVLELIVAVLRALVAERWSGLAAQQAWQVEPLAEIFLQTIRAGDVAVIQDENYLRMFGVDAAPLDVRTLWRHLFRDARPPEGWSTATESCLEMFLQQGCLARRITRSTGSRPDPIQLRLVYRELGRCLQEGQCYEPEPTGRGDQL